MGKFDEKKVEKIVPKVLHKKDDNPSCSASSHSFKDNDTVFL